MADESCAEIEGLTKYLFTAPSWPRSVAIILMLGIVLDTVGVTTQHTVRFFGLLGFVLPAMLAFIFTKPLVELYGKPITWNRSALLAMSCTVFSIIIAFSPILLLDKSLLPVLFAVSLGFIFAVRLLVLVAIADYRMSHMLIPGFVQSAAGIAGGAVFFGSDFALFAVSLQLVFAAGVILFLWLVERPMRRNFHVSILSFINAFIAHNTDGSKNLEDFFREIGEEVYVPQVSLFVKKEGRHEAIFTVPNVHPGPMGEIGGGNLPRLLHDGLGLDTMVPHGCATHDFNLVSESEAEKIIAAVVESRSELTYSSSATRSMRFSFGTVQVLAQAFGDTLLMVSTRSPDKTEDLDYPLGLAIMSEAHRHFEHAAFVDGHNCMVDVTDPVMPASYTALEYMQACKEAASGCSKAEGFPAEVGFSHQGVPFTREQGLGDLGIQTMVVKTDNQTTAYILFDGNNMVQGMREKICSALSGMVDECEVMTSDSHVVNTISGKNPVGYRATFEELMPFVKTGVQEALTDCGPAEVGGTTAMCEGVVVFGSQRISQLASSVNAMLVFVAPLGLAILIIAFILSFAAYLVLM